MSLRKQSQLLLGPSSNALLFHSIYQSSLHLVGSHLGGKLKSLQTVDLTFRINAEKASPASHESKVSAKVHTAVAGTLGCWLLEPVVIVLQVSKLSSCMAPCAGAV